MRKYLFLAAVLLLVSVFSVSAQGYHRAYSNTPYYGDTRFDITEYNGKLILEEGELPVIVSGNDKTRLLIPVETVDKLDLTDGKEIRVKGVEFRKRFFVFKGKTVLVVNEIETEGNTYFVSSNDSMIGFRRGFGKQCW